MNYQKLMKELNEIFPFENYIKEFSAGDPYKTVFSIATQYLPNNTSSNKQTVTIILPYVQPLCDEQIQQKNEQLRLIL